MKITAKDGKPYSVWRFMLVLFPCAIVHSIAVLGAVLWGVGDDINDVLWNWAKVKEGRDVKRLEWE